MRHFIVVGSTKMTVVHEGTIVDVLLYFKTASEQVNHFVYETHSHTIFIISSIPEKPLGKVFNVYLSSILIKLRCDSIKVPL